VTRKPMKLGFKHLPHAEKMEAKRKHRAELAAMGYSDPGARVRIDSMVNAMRAVRHKNGVGPKPAFKKFLVSREAV
jgi:hypothetical protein